MDISNKGLQFIKDREGFRAKAYKDGGGVWTIGYGTITIHGRPVGPSDTCTETQASAWLIKHVEDKCYRSLKGLDLSQGQFDALCSFIYNVGANAFAGSTLLKKIKAYDFKGAALEFLKWINIAGKPSPGLLSRRILEKQMFES